MSPSTRRDTTSCSPWCRSACVSSEEISSGCCIMWPFMSWLRVSGRRGLRGVGFVGARRAQEGGDGDEREERHARERRVQPDGVGEQAGEQGSRRQPEKVL